MASISCLIFIIWPSYGKAACHSDPRRSPISHGRVNGRQGARRHSMDHLNQGCICWRLWQLLEMATSSGQRKEDNDHFYGHIISYYGQSYDHRGRTILP